MDTNLFEKIGLTKGEIKVYLALINLGSTSAGAIIKETGLQRSAVYFCMDSLIKKGLVGYIIKNNRKYFEANKPESLFELLEERKKGIEKQEQELKKFVPILFFKKQLSEKEQEAKIYEGWKGVLNAFFDALESLKKEDESCAFSPTADYGGANPQQVRNLITKVRLERARKKVKLRMIMCEDLKQTLGKDQEKTSYTEVRYLPKRDMNPAVVNIYGGTILIVLWTNSPIAFLLRNKDIAKSFKNYFELLWEQAKA